MFELGRFITEEMKRKELKRSEVVRRLGYANINRGIRRLAAKRQPSLKEVEWQKAQNAASRDFTICRTCGTAKGINFVNFLD